MALSLAVVADPSAPATRTATAAPPIPITVRRQVLSSAVGGSGRTEWLRTATVASWLPSETAIVVVDMWNDHWCKSDVTRIQEIAVPMNHTLGVARELGIHVVFAPSDVTQFYANTTVRRRTLALPNATLPPRHPRYNASTMPTFPLGTTTDGSCDDGRSKPGSPWTRQLETLHIDSQRDYLIAADLPGNSMAGAQELFNVVRHEGIRNIVYVGVHENMCVMEHPFAIEAVASWGWPSDRMAVMRELVDASCNPADRPYVSHARGLEIHTSR